MYNKHTSYKPSYSNCHTRVIRKNVVEVMVGVCIRQTGLCQLLMLRVCMVSHLSLNLFHGHQLSGNNHVVCLRNSCVRPGRARKPPRNVIDRLDRRCQIICTTLQCISQKSSSVNVHYCIASKRTEWGWGCGGNCWDIKFCCCCC